VNDLGIIVSAWLDPRIVDIENLDHKALFESNREAMARAIHKAMNNKPDIDWLLANQDRITHEVYRMSLEGRDY
jgi:formaldehyde-activating enzyme